MKSLSTSDIESLSSLWQDLVGGRLQEVFAAERDLVLGIWWKGQMSWLWFDLRPHSPMVLRFDGALPERPKKTKPVQLFLRAHGKNRYLTYLAPIPEVGRALRWVFGPQNDGDACIMDVWLFPHGQNIFVRVGSGKKMSWHKPRELKGLPQPQKLQKSNGSRSVEWWREMAQDWLRERVGSGGASKKKTVIQQWQQDLDKKTKALARMNQEWEQQVRVPWAEIGQWLKTHQSLDVSQVWMGYIDMNLSLSENIENCFTQVREYQRRENGVEKRRRVLSEEILQLTEQLQQPVTPQDIKKAEKIPWEPAAQLRTYRIELGEGLQVYRGRSAKDNLGLLRKAPPWTLWLHLRDYPGSYGFIRRDKQQAVKDNLIYEAAKWLVKETVGKKIGMGRFAVVCTECRYVRPIKGDRQGRVQIQKERVFNVEI